MEHANNPGKPYKTDAEIEAIVWRFESCQLGAGEFRHREHLTVILWYLWNFPTLEAAARMREGLYKFLAHHAVDRQKYHETITIFWVRKVRALLDGKERQLLLTDFANEVISACGDAKLINAYYSRERLASDAARKEWAEPDLQPLDF